MLSTLHGRTKAAHGGQGEKMPMSAVHAGVYACTCVLQGLGPSYRAGAQPKDIQHVNGRADETRAACCAAIRKQP